MRYTLATAAIAVAIAVLSTANAADISYNRDIRPILSDNCFHCHGPDKRGRKADLRLDIREEAIADHDGFRAIVPSKPEESEMMLRILSKDKDEQMPPPDSHKSLKPGEAEKLREWIAAGAPYESHWAFTTPVRPAIPPHDAARHGNAIDGFVEKRLAKEGLKPSPVAAPESIIRRMTFDLIGLPPTPQEIDDFVGKWNASPDPSQRKAVVEQLADRLLASPKYGEKMAVGWLDLARYADTHGYHLDSGRDMWPWRTWVIDAFNRNQRWDEFVRWQLAGDLLPNATREQRLATGFIRNNMINFEGGAIAEEYLNAYVVDRVNTVGTVFLGLTLQCMQCHDHKFDPLTQKEYYQIYAYFNAVPENGLDGRNGNAAPLLKLPTPEQEQQIAVLNGKIKDAEKALSEAQQTIAAEQVAWEQSLGAGRPIEWHVLPPTAVNAQVSAKLIPQEDGSVLATGENPPTEEYELVVRPERSGLTGFRLEALADESLPGRGPGRAHNGNFVLTDVVVEDVSEPSKAKPVKISSAGADYEQRDFQVAKAIDTDPKSGWAVDGREGNATRVAWFAFANAVDAKELKVKLKFRSHFGQHAIGRVRLAVSTDAAVLTQAGAVPLSISQILGVAPEARTESQRKKVADHYAKNVSPKLKEQSGKLEALRKDLAAFEKTVATSMVMAQMEKPRPTHIRLRGQYDLLGDEVQPGIPAVLGSLAADAPKDRRALAEWIVDAKNPLMARVTVNRFWKQVFGNGLVETVYDFGLQGEWPSHPELLDWLSVEFIESGWDVKHLMKLMVTSATYLQSSSIPPELLAHDPDNRLYARGPRFRLAAEEIRDTALAVSGLLDGRIGGPSVSPYQPAGLWEELSHREDSKNWSAQYFVQSYGPDLYRRSLYTFWKRTSPPPQMITFDAPDREVCTASRERTNTPLQALTQMNDTGFFEAARTLAERLIREGGQTPEERVRYGFRLTTGRAPNAKESAALLELLSKQKTRYADGKLAVQLVSQGEAPRDERIDVHELAAWTIISTTLLNLDETVTKG